MLVKGYLLRRGNCYAIVALSAGIGALVSPLWVTIGLSHRFYFEQRLVVNELRLSVAALGAAAASSGT